MKELKQLPRFVTLLSRMYSVSILVARVPPCSSSDRPASPVVYPERRAVSIFRHDRWYLTRVSLAIALSRYVHELYPAPPKKRRKGLSRRTYTRSVFKSISSCYLHNSKTQAGHKERIDSHKPMPPSASTSITCTGPSPLHPIAPH